MKQKPKQGRAVFAVEMKITDDDGKRTAARRQGVRPPDGRGAADRARLFQGRRRRRLDSIAEGDGWFDTGDVATLDELGFMQITDRAKDVIKSGGEWISSIDIENIAVGRPGRRPSRGRSASPTPNGTSARCSSSSRKPGAKVTKDEVLQIPRRQDRQMVDARRCRLRRRNPARRHRQDQKGRLAPAVQGLQTAHRLTLSGA